MGKGRCQPLVCVSLKKGFQNPIQGMSPFISKTPIFQTTGMRHKKRGPTNRDKSSNFKTGYRGSVSYYPRVLQPNVPGTKTQQSLETSDRFVRPEQLCSLSDICHGDARENQRCNASTGLGYISGPLGRLPPSSYSPKTPSFPTVCFSRQSMAIPRTAIRSLGSSMAVYHVGRGSAMHSPTSRDHYACLPGRLAAEISVQKRTRDTDHVATGAMSVPRPAGKYGEIRIDPKPRFCIPGLQVHQSQSFCSSLKQEDVVDTEHGKQIFTREPQYSSNMAFTVGSPLINRKIGSIRQTSYPESTVLLEKPMEPILPFTSDQGVAESGSYAGDSLVAGPQQSIKGQSNSCNPSNPSYVCRCLQGRLGCTFQHADGVRSVGPLCQYLAHQCPRAPGSSSCTKTLGTTICQPDRAGSFRQFHSGSLYQSSGWNPLQDVVSSNNCSSELVLPEENKFKSQTHSGESQCASGQSVQTGTNSPVRVVTSSKDIPCNLQGDFHSLGRFVCHQGKSQITQLCLPNSRSSSLGNRCSVPFMGGSVGLCIPPNSHSSKDSQQDCSRTLQNSFSCTSLPKSFLVSESVKTSSVRANCSATYTRPSKAASVSSIPLEPEQPESARLVAIRKAIRNKGFSSKSSKLISESVRSSTAEVYDSKWRVFSAWCGKREIDPVQASIQEIAEFLVEKSEGGSAASTIAGYRSAIAHTLSHTSGLDVGSNEELSHLIKNFYLSSTKLRNPIPSWNLALVLQMLREPPFEPIDTVPMNMLTLKTVFLLALASGRRRGEIHAIERKSISWPEDKSSLTLRMVPDFLAKTQVAQDFQSLQPIIIKSLSQFLSQGMLEDLKLCPVRAIFCYLKRTKDPKWSENKKLLFVSMKSGHTKDISKATISSWIKKTIVLAYKNSNQKDWDAHKVKAHQVRALASSTAFYNKAPLNEVLKACTWTSHNTFTSFYLHNMSEQMGELLRLAPFIAGQSAVIPR